MHRETTRRRLITWSRAIRAKQEAAARRAGLERAGLPPVTFHELRHTAATLLLSEGEHPKVVQELLGHAQVSITLDRYSHMRPG